MAFATQKLTEISALAKSANGQRDGDYFRANALAVGSRVTSQRIHDPAVKARLAAVTPDMAQRKTPFSGPHRPAAETAASRCCPLPASARLP